MWSAIIGDIIGSTFEIENHRSQFFELFRKDARFTDDTICTLAVANILNSLSEMPEKESDSLSLNKNWVSNKMRVFCCPYLNRGFGSLFYQWLTNGVNKPYNSYGNGALMRISPVAYFGYKNKIDIKEIKNIALDITAITHNHIESFRAVSCYIEILYFLLNNSNNNLEKKDLILKILKEYNYNNLKEIEYYKLNLEFDLTCEISLLVACEAIIEANCYEDVFRLVVSAGGDTDTYCAIAGPIAEAIWGLDHKYVDSAKSYFKSYDKELLNNINLLYGV